MVLGHSAIYVEESLYQIISM